MLFMKSIILKFILVFLPLAILTSCSFATFHTSINLPQTENKNSINTFEVSTGDWITYIVATSFEKTDTIINLGDHLDIINSKLPDLKLPGWSSYTIKALLRNDTEKESELVCNDCLKWCNRIYVSSTAWDSIKKYQLLDVSISGITYEQAMDYVAYQQNILNHCVEPSKKNKRQYRYECFLPKPAQFDSVLAVSDSVNSKSCPLFNFKNCVCLDCPYGKKLEKMPVARMSGKAPVYVSAYAPNDFGIFNLKGNVAEMTSEKGIAKGGSFAHFATEATPGSSQEYSKPELWLGFRVWYRVYPK